MIKKLLFYIGICILLVSCAQEKINDKFLDQVESLMDSYPDSALTLLRQIDSPRKLHEQQRADYALLLTQALDKTYLDSLQSDSLISKAAEYYKGKGNNVKAGKAYYYYGKMMVLKKRLSEAMQAYLEALHFLEGSEEYKMLGLVWEHIGYLNSTQGMYPSSIENYKKSIECYDLAGADRGALYGHRNIARGYFALHNADSARWYANRGLMLSDTVSNMKSSFLQLLGLIATDEKQYSQAIDYFLSAIRASHNMNDKYRCYLSLGRTYIETGQSGKARKCFDFCRNATNAFVSSGAYSCLSDISKEERDYQKAFEYKEKSDSILEIVRNAELQRQLLDLQSKYENEKLVMENKQVKLEKASQTYFYLFLLMVVVVASVAIVVGIRRFYKKQILRDIEIIRNNAQKIEKYACRITDLENAGMQEHEAKKEEIGKLNRKILLLTTENKQLRESSSNDALCLLESLKQGNLIIENMTDSERQCILDFLDLIHADFITRLKKDFKLTKNELLLAALLKVGFSNKQLMVVFDCEQKSIYKNRQRLKQSLGLGKNDSLEQMVMMY